MMSLRTLLAYAALSFAGILFAAPKDAPFDPLSANIEENIANPPVEAKNSAAVAEAMSKFGAALREKGYDVDNVRKGEVVMVTIRCSALFAPNSTKLLPTAEALLAPLLQYIISTDNYKIVLAAHADNTGDDTYAERITADRANAIDEFFYRINGNKDTGLIPYGLGSDEPVAPNTGVANRAKNRRVEIYFVPTAELIDKIKRNK